MTVDTETLAVTLAERLGTDRPSLVPLGVKCAWPVFRAEIAGHSPIFVKVTERAAAERALAFLGALAGGCPFLPRPVLLEAPALGELAVLCLEWKEARRVNAEDMTEGQLGSFLDGCVRLSRALAAFTGPVAPLGEDAPDRQHAQLAAYAARHPFAGRLLRPLLGKPVTSSTYYNVRAAQNVRPLLKRFRELAQLRITLGYALANQPSARNRPSESDAFPFDQRPILRTKEAVT